MNLKVCFKNDPFEVAMHWDEQSGASGYHIFGNADYCGTNTSDPIQVSEDLAPNITWFIIPPVNGAQSSQSYDLTVQAMSGDQVFDTDRAGNYLMGGAC